MPSARSDTVRLFSARRYGQEYKEGRLSGNIGGAGRSS